MHGIARPFPTHHRPVSVPPTRLQQNLARGPAEACDGGHTLRRLDCRFAHRCRASVRRIWQHGTFPPQRVCLRSGQTRVAPSLVRRCISSATAARHGGDHMDVTPVRRDTAITQVATGARLSRRAALRRLVSGGGIILLAACAQQPPATAPAATSAPAAKPAEAAKPAGAGDHRGGRPRCHDRAGSRVNGGARPGRGRQARRPAQERRHPARRSGRGHRPHRRAPRQRDRHRLDRVRSPDRLRREAPAPADAGRELGRQQRLQADQAEPPQGRPVPHRPRAHQRGCQVEHPARPRPEDRRRGADPPE